MKRTLRIGAALLLTLPCSGCFPYHFATKPQVTGYVVDARSQHPVAGAAVHYDGSPQPPQHTAGDGSFTLSAERHWGVIFFLPPDIPFKATFEVSASGYRKESREVESYGAPVQLQSPVPLQPAH